MSEGTVLRLSELARHLEFFFKKKFEGRLFRVIGEVSNHKPYPSKRWHFFDLIEKDSEGDKLVAKMNAVAWSPGYASVVAFEQETGQAFTNGLEVLLTCELSFSGQYGLKLTVVSVDVGYTLGQMERRRREVLKQLTERYPTFIRLSGGKYVTANQGLMLPLVIKRIAVVSSPSADGLEDFLHTLRHNHYGYTFSIDLYYARVQGPQAPPMLTRRMAEINSQAQGYDLAVMIRGGGNQSDLFVFDDYALNREIARLSVPLWTGIGHQRDQTIADLFSHESHKTPTMAGEAILRHNRAAEERAYRLKERLVASARQGVEQRKQRMQHLSLVITARTPRLIKMKQQQLNGLNGRMVSASQSSLATYKNAVNQWRVDLKRLARMSMQRKGEQLALNAATLGSSTRFLVKQSHRELLHSTARLVAAQGNFLKLKTGKLNHQKAMIKALHPEQLLKRGFALVERNNHLISAHEAISKGEHLHIIRYRSRLEVSVNDVKERSSENDD